MSRRLSELLFGRLLILLLPITLFSLAGAFWGYSSAKSVWLSSATVWVERPSELNVLSGVESNPYNSPAQNQAGSMKELLTTKSFMARILARVGQPDPAWESIERFRMRSAIFTLGSHTIAIQFRGDTAAEAAQSVKALLAEFGAYYALNAKQKATEASAFYQEQSKLLKADYDVASVELRAYIATRPQFANINLANPPASALTDVEFSRLLQNAESAKSRYEQALDKYAETQIAARSSDAAKGAFNVVDEPEVPLYPTTMTKSQLLVKPMLGFVVGSTFAGLLFLVFWRLDNRVRVVEDLAFLGDVEITALPSLRTRKQFRWPKSFVRIAAALQCGLLGLHPVPPSVSPSPVRE